MPRYLLFLFVLSLGLLNVSFAANKAKPVQHKAVLKSDSSTIVVRNFDKAALKSYNKQPEFNYIEDESGPSLWTRFWRWFWNLFSPKGKTSDGVFSFILACLGYLLIGSAVAGVVFFIIKMIGVDMSNIFRRNAGVVIVPYTESTENIHELDFDAQIEKAVSLHNYRLAVRLLYLKCLKQLSDASLIQWQPEKTNNAYVNELSNPEQRVDFKLLTRQFEYVWYGEFAIDNSIFSNINMAFQKFRII